MSHWYLPDGSPFYTLIGKNGKERDVTLRDARPVKAVPSVTTIMSVQDRPNLLIWKQNQLLDAAVANPFHPFDDEKEWRNKILRQSNEVGRKAAETGTRIHDELENMIKGNGWSDRNLAAVCSPVLEFLKATFPGFEWVAEDSFAHPLGFGGKIDLYGTRGTERMVLDFKTKDKSSEDIDKLVAYDDHHLQTAAYVKGLEDTKNFDNRLDYSLWKRYNLFIGYEVADYGLKFTGIKLTESKDFEREWGMFETLLAFWKLRNKYDIGKE